MSWRVLLTQKIRNSASTTISGIEYDPNSASEKELKDRLKTSQEAEHQTRWQQETRGRATYEFFPTVKERQEAPWIKPSYYVTQFLSGHGNFRAKLRKFSLVPSDLCRCGQQDTSRHTFYECPAFEEIRGRYRAETEELGIPWPISAKNSITKTAIGATVRFIRKVLQVKEELDRG